MNNVATKSRKKLYAAIIAATAAVSIGAIGISANASNSASGGEVGAAVVADEPANDAAEEAVVAQGGELQEAAQDSEAPGAEAQIEAAAQQKVTRKAIMDRANKWLREKVPYSNTKYHDKYRQDCSGFTSFVWQSGRSYTTRTLHQISHPIKKDELKAGDALLWVNPNPNKMGHVRVFGGWLDNAHTRYWTIEQTPNHTVKREYTWSKTAAQYKPVRYNHVVD